MVPEPMISTPFSAWILGIENIRSCLRIVDAPSTPISSDIATRSAGLFFFSSFKCIRRSFLGDLCSSFCIWSTKPEGGRTPREIRKAVGDWGNWPEPLACRGMSRRCQSQSEALDKRPKCSERADDHQDDDDRDGDPWDLVDHPELPGRKRPLAGGELVAVAAEPALI